MIETIHLIIVLAWLTLFVGLMYKDYTITILGALFLMALSVYIYSYGLTNINNFLTETFALIHFGVGAYVSIRGSYEVYKDWGK